jgi:hypothetical protein
MGWAMCVRHHSPSLVCASSRGARTFRRCSKVEIEGIAIGAASEDDSFPDMINKMYSTVNTHRNIIDLDWRFCLDGTDYLA